MPIYYKNSYTVTITTFVYKQELVYHYENDRCTSLLIDKSRRVLSNMDTYVTASSSFDGNSPTKVKKYGHRTKEQTTNRTNKALICLKQKADAGK